MSIYAILVILLVGLIAFFHWLQGFFSATISAILAIIASMMAIAYYEPIVNLLLGGQMADQAGAMVLIALFAGIYILLRVIFDKAIPGNLRLPSTVDKVGGAAMGLVAGIFAVGTLTVAAQMLPFGPTVAGYSRNALGADRTTTATIFGRTQRIDTQVVGELANDSLDQGRTRLVLPVDDWVLALAERQSAKGALAGERPLTAVHPDLLTELFANRVGLQPGARQTALNIPGRQDVRVTGGFLVGRASQQWAQPSTIRKETLPREIVSNDAQTLLVLRIDVSAQAAGDNDIFRFSPGTARLVVDGRQYFPIGTMAAGGAVLRSRPDDPLYLQISGEVAAANLVFLVPAGEVFTKSNDQISFAPGAFLAVKRLALVDLSDVKLQHGTPPADQVLIKGAAVPSQQQSQQQPDASAAAPLRVNDVMLSRQLFSPINVGTPEDKVNNVRMRSGTFSLQDRRFSRLQVDGTESLNLMARGEYVIGEFYVPSNMSMVQVAGMAPPESGSDKWAWADSLRDFELVSSDGRRFTPNGAWARLSEGTTERMVAAYAAEGSVPSLPGQRSGTPTDVWIGFVVPSGTRIAQLTYKGQTVRTLDLATP